MYAIRSYYVQNDRQAIVTAVRGWGNAGDDSTRLLLRRDCNGVNRPTGDNAASGVKTIEMPFDLAEVLGTGHYS